jgi:hypothetical protein
VRSVVRVYPGPPGKKAPEIRRSGFAFSKCFGKAERFFLRFGKTTKEGILRKEFLSDAWFIDNRIEMTGNYKLQMFTTIRKSF